MRWSFSCEGGRQSLGAGGQRHCLLVPLLALALSFLNRVCQQSCLGVCRRAKVKISSLVGVTLHQGCEQLVREGALEGLQFSFPYPPLPLPPSRPQLGHNKQKRTTNFKTPELVCENWHAAVILWLTD